MTLAPRWGTPRDTAGLVAFLVSEAAGWITGQTIDSDGGWSIRNGVEPRAWRSGPLSQNRHVTLRFARQRSRAESLTGRASLDMRFDSVEDVRRDPAGDAALHGGRR